MSPSPLIPSLGFLVAGLLALSCAERPEGYSRSGSRTDKSADVGADADKGQGTNDPDDKARDDDPKENELPKDPVVMEPVKDDPQGDLPIPEPRCFKMMTFNLRYDVGSNSSAMDVNGWNNKDNPRRLRVKAVLDKAAPDVFGTQEGYNNQIQDLKADHPAYDFWGVGREDGKKSGEFAGIFYRRDLFLFQVGGHFWLSETPEKPGTTFPSEGNTRMASWARLKDVKTSVNYLVVNTHWGLTAASRRSSADLMVSRLKEIVQADDKLIVMGDLNSEENKAEVVTLRTKLQLNDSFRLARPTQSRDEASYHGFGGDPNGERIDHILIPQDFKATSAEILRDNISGLFPSDHFPIQVNMCAMN